MSAVALARPEIAALAPYETAVQRDETLRLNANEVPRGPDGADGMNRYPPIRPDGLERRLADLFGVPGRRLLVTRGSSEAIDLLVRTFCRAYRDNVVVMPPTFAMYRVYAAMQSAGIVEVPLAAGDDFRPDLDAVLESADENSKLIFICSPNNPTGRAAPRDALRRLLAARRDRSLVVVDEAYVEFSSEDSLVAELDRHPNLVVLRTLSKAWGLAGTRCGAVAASDDVIALLRRMLPPYAFSTPSTNTILAGLENACDAAERCRAIVAERERLYDSLTALPGIDKVWRSEANFLLVRFADLAATRKRLEARGILVRAWDGDPALAGCARITVGTAGQNDRLLETLAADTALTR